MRPIIAFAFILISLTAGLFQITAQEPTSTPAPVVISTVNDTPITDEMFRTRVELEAWIIAREVGGFARTFYDQNRDADEMIATIRTVYGVQLASLEDVEAFGSTVLNSMEVDEVLRDIAAAQDITVTDAEVEALMLAHITRAEGLGAPTDENSIETFLMEAQAAIGADEAAVQSLFEGRALREVFYRAVTNTDENSERTVQQNRTFQEWAFAQVQSANITRIEDWAAYVPEDTNYREAVTEAIAAVITAELTAP